MDLFHDSSKWSKKRYMWLYQDETRSKGSNQKIFPPPKKRPTPLHGNLVIQSDLFGMVKWPFQGVKWPPTRGSKGHFESPGIDFFCWGPICLLLRPALHFLHGVFHWGGGWLTSPLKIVGRIIPFNGVVIKLSTKTEASSTGCRGSSKSCAKGASGRERAMNRA